MYIASSARFRVHQQQRDERVGGAMCAPASSRTEAQQDIESLPVEVSNKCCYYHLSLFSGLSFLFFSSMYSSNVHPGQKYDPNRRWQPKRLYWERDPLFLLVLLFLFLRFSSGVRGCATRWTPMLAPHLSFISALCSHSELRKGGERWGWGGRGERETDREEGEGMRGRSSLPTGSLRPLGNGRGYRV